MSSRTTAELEGADPLALERQVCSPLVKRLEAAGLVRRERDTRDERVLVISLTDAGRVLRSRAERIPAGIVERLGMDVAELTALHQSLGDVIAASQQALDRSAHERGD